jgi:hypothetical protein
MKCQHLRSVFHTLTLAEKAVCPELGQSMLHELAKHKPFNCNVLFTGDVLWMVYVEGHRTMQVASWDDIHEIE